MNVHFSSATDLWATPQSLFDELNQQYHFTLNPCATHANAKCAKHFTRQEDGLSQNWDGETVFMNPPYGREIGKWVAKAVSSKATVVMLLPARTDTRWFHDHLYGNPDVELDFLKGRLKLGSATNSAPFPSLIAHYRWQPSPYRQVVPFIRPSRANAIEPTPTHTETNRNQWNEAA